MPSLPVRASTADSPEIALDTTRRGHRRHLLLKVIGWLIFGIAMMIGSLDVMPWHAVLATESVYVVIGLILALLLERIYDRLGVEPGSFGRTLAISVVGACLAGMLWNVLFYYHRQYTAVILHSLIIGGPSPLRFPR